MRKPIDMNLELEKQGRDCKWDATILAQQLSYDPVAMNAAAKVAIYDLAPGCAVELFRQGADPDELLSLLDALGIDELVSEMRTLVAERHEAKRLADPDAWEAAREELLAFLVAENFEPGHIESILAEAGYTK